MIVKRSATAFSRKSAVSSSCPRESAAAMNERRRTRGAGRVEKMADILASGRLLRVVPPSDISRQPVRFGGSPRARLIDMRRRDVTEYRLDDGPRRLHCILTDEE